MTFAVITKHQGHWPLEEIINTCHKNYVTPTRVEVQNIWKTGENTQGLLSMLHVLSRYDSLHCSRKCKQSLGL